VPPAREAGRVRGEPFFATGPTPIDRGGDGGQLVRQEESMEFLVDFEVTIPVGMPAAEIEARQDAEAAAAVRLAEAGHLLRVWKRPAGTDATTVLGLYRADSRDQLDDLLAALPLREWMDVTVTPLAPHPNDPVPPGPVAGRPEPTKPGALPEPRLTLVFRLEATLGSPSDLGDVAQGRRRIVPLTGGTFTGPELHGSLVPGASADWQVVRPDGTALGDIRYTLRTDRGDLLFVRSSGVRHGPPEVLARLRRGEDVDPSEYTFRLSTQIETSAPDLDWLNKGVFLGVGGRQAGGVTYETYLVA
jgi:muconolactone delta-isomerase